MKTNTTFKREALDALRGNWGKAVLITLLYIVIAGALVGPTTYTSLQMQRYMTENAGNGIQSLSKMTAMVSDPDFVSLQKTANGVSGGSTLIQVFVLFPLMLGVANAFRKLLVDRDNNLVRNAFHEGFSNYFHKVWGMLLMTILLALWTLLLFIPGIIKAYSYSMTPYILAENPELSASEAIHRSRMMMRGHKFDLFWLQLSFIGWVFLSLLTAGIGFLWMDPYYRTAQAAFYEEVKADYALNGGLA